MFPVVIAILSRTGSLEAVVAQGSGRTWLVLVAPETCWSTERVLEAIDRSERPVERIDLDGPSTLLLVK